MFTEINTNKQYIGSAMNFNIRFNHLRMKDGSLRKLVLQNGRWDKFNFGMVYITTNYLKIFRNTYPSDILSQGEALYLMHLTHIEASPPGLARTGKTARLRMLEQSLIKAYKSDYNKEDNVTFVVTFWNSDWLNSLRSY